MFRQRPVIHQAAVTVANLARQLAPPPTRIVIPLGGGRPLVQLVPSPMRLAQAGGVLDQSAWLASAIDIVSAENAALDRTDA